MKGIVVCPQPRAADVGVEILGAGGNAFDAALGTAFAQMVLDPFMCGLGGMGSVPGAIFGGLILGIVEAHSTWYLGTEYRDLVAYGLLFAFLVLRPGGLLGQSRALREHLALRRV